MRLALAITVVAISAGLLRVLRSDDMSPDLDTAASVNVQLTDKRDMLDRLGAALRHKTISSLAAPDHALAPDSLSALHTTLFEAFPEAFTTLKLELVSC